MQQEPERPPGGPIRRDLRAGIAIIVPIAVTAWAVTWLFRFFDNVLGRMVGPLFPVPVPGLGVLLLLLAILAVGALSRTRAGVAFILWLDRRLSAIPLASWVYGTATQITQSTIEARSGTFRRCVLVEFPQAGSWALGFVTADAPPVLSQKVGVSDLVTVFVPTSPNPTSGFLLLVPDAEALDTGLPVETGFRLIISAGSIRVDTAGDDPRRALEEFLERI